MRFRILSAALAAIALGASPAVAQPDPPPLVTPDPPPVLKRVADLERENVLLKARVSALENAKTASKGETADRWTHASYPGVVFTKAQLSAMYPGIAFNTTAAPGVARTTAPFPCQDGECNLAGCSTTPTTPVIAAGTPAPTRTYGPEPSAEVVTGTAAGCAATSGGTSGCSAAGCSVQSSGGRWYLGKNLGRR